MQTTIKERVKLPTISEDELKMMWRQDPFDAFETIPTAESRIRCLDQIAGDGTHLSRLLEWAPGWLEFFLEKQDVQLATKLLNVWIFHFAHSEVSLVRSVNSALILAMDQRFRDGNLTLEMFSREVCSRLLKSCRSVYWDVPKLHPFLDACSSRLLLSSFSERDWNVVRRALKVVCEAGDTSMLPRLTELRGQYHDMRKGILGEEPARNAVVLWRRMDFVYFETTLDQCIAYLAGLQSKESEQWQTFRNLLRESGRKIGVVNPEPLLKYPSPQRARSANPVTVGLFIGGVQGILDSGLPLNLMDGLTVTFLGDGFENNQVFAMTPAKVDLTGEKVGKFDRNLECLFRISEGLEGKKRFRLQVHATEPICSLRPMPLCTLTGYLQFE